MFVLVHQQKLNQNISTLQLQLRVSYFKTLQRRQNNTCFLFPNYLRQLLTTGLIIEQFCTTETIGLSFGFSLYMSASSKTSNALLPRTVKLLCPEWDGRINDHFECGAITMYCGKIGASFFFARGKIGALDKCQASSTFAAYENGAPRTEVRPSHSCPSAVSTAATNYFFN